MMLSEQQIENTRKWITALRSGDYEQTTEVLKSPDGFCCLGVACDINPETTKLITNQNVEEGKYYEYIFPVHDSTPNDPVNYSSVPNNLWFEDTFGFPYDIPLKSFDKKTIALIEKRIYPMKVRDIINEWNKSNDEEHISLWYLNDSALFSFNDIADVIENYLELLIKEQTSKA